MLLTAAFLSFFLPIRRLPVGPFPHTRPDHCQLRCRQVSAVQDRARTAAGATPAPSPLFRARRVLAALPRTATTMRRQGVQEPLAGLFR
jgi:hypothetical protein